MSTTMKPQVGNLFTLTLANDRSVYQYRISSLFSTSHNSLDSTMAKERYSLLISKIAHIYSYTYRELLSKII